MLSPWLEGTKLFGKNNSLHKCDTFSYKIDEGKNVQSSPIGAGIFDIYSGTYFSNKSKNDIANRLLNASLKSDEKVSIFLCSNKSDYALANNAIRQLKTLKHPMFLQYIDSLLPNDSEWLPNVTRFVLVTEYAVPLFQHLEDYENMNNEMQKPLETVNRIKNNYFAYGINQIIRGISFMHENNLIHGGLYSGSIFITAAYQWKIFGLEKTRSSLNRSSQTSDMLDEPCNWPEILIKYQPPELKNGQVSKIEYSSDLWGLGCIIWEVFNGQLCKTNNLNDMGKIPNFLQNLVKQLHSKIPSKRPLTSKILECSQEYFDNSLINSMKFLEEFTLKHEHEKSSFLSELTESKLKNLPDCISQKYILPKLSDICMYKHFDGPEILTPLLSIGKILEDIEYERTIIPCLLRLFSNKSRNVRFMLLNKVEEYSKYLNSKHIDHIFPQIESGFKDQDWKIREKTVVAIIYLAAKLNSSQLNDNVIKNHFIHLLNDQNNTVRTNTTVTLGKIAPFLHYKTRQECLIPSFGRKTFDPFVPARIAALQAFGATNNYYSISETSSKVLPIICKLTTDKELIVRELAFKIVTGFLHKLEQVSNNESLKEEMEADIKISLSGSHEPNMVSTAKCWASWARESLNAKFYRSDPISVSNKATIVENQFKEELLQSFKDANTINNTKESEISVSSGDKNLIDFDEAVKCNEVDSWGDWEDKSDNSEWGYL